jgi:hypothetical protein
MPRHKCGEKTKGSQRWLQCLVRDHTHVIDDLRRKLGLEAGAKIEWLSPRSDDDYAEYSDQAFLERLGISLPKRALDEFWPARGPVWDGLARIDGGRVVLVEAKAHIGEFASPPSQASGASRRKIEQSLGEVRRFLKGRPDVQWSAVLYQYTNRLAHLYLLRVLNRLPAHLVLISFFNAEGVPSPKSSEQWQGAYELADALLGLKQHKLTRYVHHVFVDCQSLSR